MRKFVRDRVDSARTVSISTLFPLGMFCAIIFFMAAIDSLLRLMDSQNADRLVVVSDDIPTLAKGGEAVKLSMPAIPGDLVKIFSLEVVGADRTEAFSSGERIQGSYRAGDGTLYAFEASKAGSVVRLELQPAEPRNQPEQVEVPQQPADVEAFAQALNSQGLEPETGSNPILSGEPMETQELSPPGAAYSAPTRPSAPLLECLEQALVQGASDIFFTAGMQPRIRVGGSLEILHGPEVDPGQIFSLGGPDFTETRRLEFERAGNVDLGVKYHISGTLRRFRLSIFRHQRGVAAALRPIRENPPTLNELNLPADFRELGSYPNGLVLLTGPAGSGKSTTLAAIVEHINQTRSRHIITLEDPIEFEHKGNLSLVHQREVGLHVESFATGLRAALRESPDVILLGEMRDLSTISAALTAAETGHLVLSTLHTGDPVSAVDRIIDVFPGRQQAQVRMQLASVLRAVVTQMLISATGMGMHQRVPTIEKLMVTSAVACQIREGRNHQLPSLIQAGGAESMVTRERSLAALVLSGKITLSTALRHARDEQGLHKLVKSMR